MAKKQKSFYLEKDILDFIMDYQQEHSLSSPNVALERIILERIYNYPINNIKHKEKSESKKEVEMPKSILSIRQSMKD